MRLFSVLLAIPMVVAAPPGLQRIGGWRQFTARSGRPSTLNCTWDMFEQKLDHFGRVPGSFPQRLCIYSKWWREASEAGFEAASGSPGPILFYTGNESPLEEYINNTGLMWEIGEQFGALIVFAEHRYEPLSHPKLCGQGTQKCFAYCTTAQALADWTAIIAMLRQKHQLRAPVVAFGGSYGGMLAGWLRMKYPDVVDGAVAASAPIWQLAGTVRQDSLDAMSVAITRGVSAVGGATDRCRDNLRAAWPLLHAVGEVPEGLRMLSDRFHSCRALRRGSSLLNWAQSPFFLMAEGNYPFPSTYITYSVGPGLSPLPAWPMRVACEGLNHDLGIQLRGSIRNVSYTLRLGELRVAVDWNVTQSNAANLSADALTKSGIGELAAAVARAVGVWYNVSKDRRCYDIPDEADPPDEAVGDAEATAETGAEAMAEAEMIRERVSRAAGTHGQQCPACPPCEDCPPCPVSYCDWEDTAPCTYDKPLPNTFSWEGISCNDALSQVTIQGVGRDIYWPPGGSPGVPSRDYTVESIVGPRHLRAGWCAGVYDAIGLRGAPLVSDPWSGWMSAYYGGRNISHHRNIVWSNGALDPWSGTGVYPPGGGPDGPMVQNVSVDGSQIALVLDLGAHHLDLMFSDERNPPCFHAARKIEIRMIRQWCQEAYAKASASANISTPSESV